MRRVSAEPHVTGRAVTVSRAPRAAARGLDATSELHRGFTAEPDPNSIAGSPQNLTAHGASWLSLATAPRGHSLAARGRAPGPASSGFPERQDQQRRHGRREEAASVGTGSRSVEARRSPPSATWAARSRCCEPESRSAAGPGRAGGEGAEGLPHPYLGRKLQAARTACCTRPPPSQTSISGNSVPDASGNKVLPALGLPRQVTVKSSPARGRAGSDPRPSSEQQLS